MRSLLKSLLLLGLLAVLPAPCFAEGPPPFQVIYRQENVVPGEYATKSELMLTVINRSGAEIRDVSVSAVHPNSFFVINVPIQFDAIPDAGQKELLVPSVVPTPDVTNDPNEEVVWQIEYTSNTGETRSVEIVGDRG